MHLFIKVYNIYGPHVVFVQLTGYIYFKIVRCCVICVLFSVFCRYKKGCVLKVLCVNIQYQFNRNIRSSLVLVRITSRTICIQE